MHLLLGSAGHHGTPNPLRSREFQLRILSGLEPEISTPGEDAALNLKCKTLLG